MVRTAERAGGGEVFAGADELGDLADVAEIVHRPFVEHLGEGDFAGFLVAGAAVAGAAGEGAQEFDVALALVFEVIEGIFGIGVAVEIVIHAGVVGLELGEVFGEEAIEPGAVAVAFGVGEVFQDFGDGETVRGGLPAGIFVTELAHEAAEDGGSGFELVEAIELGFGLGHVDRLAGMGVAIS